MKRLYSIDTLRGLSMICILGLTNWLQSFLALFPGGKDCWLYGQFVHVPWHGLAIEDLFFPTFLFVAAGFPNVGDFVWWTVFIGLNWLLGWFLYRQRIFIKV